MVAWDLVQSGAREGISHRHRVAVDFLFMRGFRFDRGKVVDEFVRGFGEHDVTH